MSPPLGCYLILFTTLGHAMKQYARADIQREIASYLSPGGALVLIWNLESDATTWDKDVRTHYERYSGTTPQYFKGWWRRCFEVDAYGELYEPAEEKSVAWEVGMTEDEVGVSVLFRPRLLRLTLFPAPCASCSTYNPPCTVYDPKAH